MIHVAPLCQSLVQRCSLSARVRNKAGYVGARARKGTYLTQSICYLVLLADVTRVERDVVIPLDDVEYRDSVAAREEGLHNVAPEETAAANNEVNVF